MSALWFSFDMDILYYGVRKATGESQNDAAANGLAVGSHASGK